MTGRQSRGAWVGRAGLLVGARAARARVQFGGGGGTPTRAALVALAAVVGLFLLTLAPARAQIDCNANPPAVGSVTIDKADILGSLDVRNYFLLRARISDTNGNQIPCPLALSWSETSDNPIVQHHFRVTTLQDEGGWSGYLVLAAGEVTITLTVGGMSGSITLQTGEPAAASPPEPASIWMTSPLEFRRSADLLTVTALVTDANGATVPDGTAVEWTATGDMPGLGPPDLRYPRWLDDSVQRTTTNGVAQATFRRAGPATGDAVMVTARAGEATGGLLTEVRRVQLAPPASAAIEIIERPSRWSSLDIGDSVTISAKVTDRDGDPVPDGTPVAWRYYEEGRANELNRPDVFVQTATGGLNNVLTTNGVSSVTYTADHEGVVWVRAFQLDQHPTWLIDVVSFNVGPYREPPSDLALVLRLVDDSDDVAPTGSTLRVGAALTYSGYGELDQALHITAGKLRTTGGLEWEAGSGALAVPAQSALTRRTVLREHMLSQQGGQLGRGAQAGARDGACKGVSEDGGTAWTCTVELGDSTIHIPPGTEEGVYIISGALTVNGREYSDTMELTVVAPGAVDEVAEVRFDFAPQERGAQKGEPYPSLITAGQSTKLRLTSLNQNGKASAAGSIASILFTTSAGSLSSAIGGGCVGGGGLICQIPVAAITASNADKIDVTLTHPGGDKSGRAEVRVTLIASDGETFSLPGIGAMLATAAASLSISEPATSLLNAATSGADDQRDVLKLIVSAKDSAGNDVAVPYRAPRATIRNPQGAIVSGGIAVVWTEDGDDAGDAHDRFILNAARKVEASVRVTTDAASPLDPGEYTLELRTGGQTATRKFAVVGPPAAVSLSAPQGTLEPSQVVSFTATVSDAASAPVPDGTPVTWSVQPINDLTALVPLSAEAATSNGSATATYLAVSEGTAVVAAAAGDRSDVALVSIAAPAPPAPPPPAESLSRSEPGAFSVWLGEGRTTASAVLEGLSGVGSLLLWQQGRWLSYGLADGREVPGSVDFMVSRGAILWLGD